MIAALHPAHAENRMRAVARMLAAVPAAKSAQDIERMARVLEGFTAPQRACWAEHCGMRAAPSEATWSLLVLNVRLRRPVAVDEIRRRFA